MTLVFTYYGVIALLLLVIFSGYAGWKVLPLAIFWPVIGTLYVMALMTSWLFYDLEDR